MKKMMGALAGAFIAAGMLCGCGESVDENKPLPEVQAEAAKLDAKQLEAKMEACKKFLEAKKAEMEEVAKKVKAIPLKDILGQEAKDLNAQMAKIGESVKKVTAQMDAYASELKAKAKTAK